MHRALGAADEARPHLDPLGAASKGRRHAATVADAAGGDHRHVDARADRLQQHQRRHLLGVLEAAPLGALNDQAVHPRIDAFQRGIDGGDRVVDGDAGVLQRPDELGGTARRGGDESKARSADKAQDRVVAQEADWQVDAKWQPGRAHLGDLGLAIRRLARRAFNDPESASARHRRRQRRARDPAHRGLKDGVAGTGMGKNAVHGGGGQVEQAASIAPHRLGPQSRRRHARGGAQALANAIGPRNQTSIWPPISIAWSKGILKYSVAPCIDRCMNMKGLNSKGKSPPATTFSLPTKNDISIRLK